MGKWFKLLDGTALEPGAHRFKIHFCDGRLLNPLTKDLIRRGMAFHEGCQQPVEGFFHFEPGSTIPSMFVGWPTLSFDCGGKELVVNVCDVYLLLIALQESLQRKFADGLRYYKLYSQYCCLVITPEERESLLAQVEAKADEADRLAEEYLAERTAAADRLRELQKAKAPQAEQDAAFEEIKVAPKGQQLRAAIGYLRAVNPPPSHIVRPPKKDGLPN